MLYLDGCCSVYFQYCHTFIPYLNGKSCGEAEPNVLKERSNKMENLDSAGQTQIAPPPRTATAQDAVQQAR